MSCQKKRCRGWTRDWSPGLKMWEIVLCFLWYYQKMIFLRSPSEINILFYHVFHRFYCFGKAGDESSHKIYSSQERLHGFLIVRGRNLSNWFNSLRFNSHTMLGNNEPQQFSFINNESTFLRVERDTISFSPIEYFLQMSYMVFFVPWEDSNIINIYHNNIQVYH